jgi:UDP:flavonoid glycosyltransferase YjiC (YdhE family)
MAAARDADLFIFTPTQFLGILIPEKTGIPAMIAAIAPPHVARQPGINAASRFFLHDLPESPANSVPPHRDGETLVNFGDHIRSFRASIGLPVAPPELPPGSDHILAAFSSHFCEADTQQFPHIDVTGFWFHQRPEWHDWRPDPVLEHFVEKGPPPLVLSFSSLPLCDAKSVLKIHARAAMLLNRRLVVLSGWAGFQEKDIPHDCREYVHVTGELPHAWLFKRSVAVINHGGIGTLARAMQCGTPSLIEPYGNDQFYNAWRAVKLGIGVAAHPRWMTPLSLADLIEKKVLSPEICVRARNMADKILRDPGVEHAADLVMARLGQDSMH